MIKIETLFINRSDGDKIEIFTGSTKEETFKKIYEYRRTFRYCNDIKFGFVNESDEKEYNIWKKNLSNIEKFNLYYGDGIVD